MLYGALVVTLRTCYAAPYKSSYYYYYLVSFPRKSETLFEKPRFLLRDMHKRCRCRYVDAVSVRPSVTFVNSVETNKYNLQNFFTTW